MIIFGHMCNANILRHVMLVWHIGKVHSLNMALSGKATALLGELAMF